LSNEEPKDLDLQQDGFRKVYFGQADAPLFPPPQEASGVEEDELTRAALEDPAGRTIHVEDPKPTFWRLVAVLFIIVVALIIVFWKH
jgi:hypothetical protein